LAYGFSINYSQMNETGHVSNNDQKSQATKNEQNKGKASDKSRRKKAVKRKSQVRFPFNECNFKCPVIL